MAEALLAAAGLDESEAELSQSLARTKTRSYGSTASVSAPLAERYIQHPVGEGDTLQGLALRYGVTTEQIKRANKLFTSDCIFLRKNSPYPSISAKGSLFNGLSLDSPENESRGMYAFSNEKPLNIEKKALHLRVQKILTPGPLSLRNFPLKTTCRDWTCRLNCQHKRLLKTIQEDDYGAGDAGHKDNPYAASSYQSLH
ncbi:LOW QUALITY PROTEIN: lysM and putative peptidoglycan-binding domain-containing protein 2 [Pristis pectinata]|uniref:LOW QUALITY PROTEIN: lysM and putative peptidoglycan-binding domain-containing protein 2 n=1 Tax=Pristis pectinata TaxID=685728 RepID=UPI00223D7149|nr:LOW QUALITY PROTEIN: lysM and putative peptidoglycan-binding domain-containing protein 2 [Pristis pectinata]